MARQMRIPGRKPGRKGELRPRGVKRILTDEQKAALIQRLKPGDNEYTRAARAKRHAAYQTAMDEFQSCDILRFATFFLKQDFTGYPFQELLLRCSEGLPLPEGKLKTFVEIESDGFAAQEVEMTWPEYFALCSSKSKVYEPGIRPAIVLARAGRRSGKSTAAAVKAIYEGTRAKWRQYLRPSEIMVIPIIATSQDQAEEIITQRCHELLQDADADWMIGAMDPKIHAGQVTNDTIPLVCGTNIVAFPCNSKKVRGEAAPLVEFDEYPHFAIEGRKKDKDIRAAATGAQAQFPGSQFWAIGTPAAEQGDFYELEQRAADDPSILALHAPSWTAAPKLYREHPDYYHNQFRLDPDAFNREFRAMYAKSVEPAFREEDVLANMSLAGPVPFTPAHRYGAGIDQSGLSGRDRFSLVICGYDPARDTCYEAWRHNWSVSDLDTIMAGCKEALRQYGLYEVLTDRYAKGYVHQALEKEGISGSVAPPSAELCMEFRRLLVARKFELPMDNEVKEGLLQTQLYFTDKAHTPSVSHPRSQKGHGDEVEARFRATHQAVTGNWSTRRNSEYDRLEEARIRREEEEYDPLCHGRS